MEMLLAPLERSGKVNSAEEVCFLGASSDGAKSYFISFQEHSSIIQCGFLILTPRTRKKTRSQAWNCCRRRSRGAK